MPSATRAISRPGARRWLAATLLGAALSVAAPSVRAESSDAETRLWEQSEGSRRWYYTWTIFFAVATAGETGLAMRADNRDDRAPKVVGAITSGLGLASTVVIPPVSGFADHRLRAMPMDTPEQRAARRAEAEKLLKEAAAEQRLGTSVLAHAAGVIVNLAAGAVLWAGYGLHTQGAFTFVSGTAVSELKISTQPTSLVGVGLGAPGANGAGLSLRGSF